MYINVYDMLDEQDLLKARDPDMAEEMGEFFQELEELLGQQFPQYPEVSLRDVALMPETRESDFADTWVRDLVGDSAYSLFEHFLDLDQLAQYRLMGTPMIRVPEYGFCYVFLNGYSTNN